MVVVWCMLAYVASEAAHDPTPLLLPTQLRSIRIRCTCSFGFVSECATNSPVFSSLGWRRTTLNLWLCCRGRRWRSPLRSPHWRLLLHTPKVELALRQLTESRLSLVLFGDYGRGARAALRRTVFSRIYSAAAFRALRHCRRYFDHRGSLWRACTRPSIRGLGNTRLPFRWQERVRMAAGEDQFDCSLNGYAWLLQRAFQLSRWHFQTFIP